MRTRRWLARVVLVAVAAGSTSGLGLAQSAASAADSIPLRAGDITGTWEGTFRLDSAWGLPQRASARSTVARVRFDPVGDASPTTSSARSVHPGTFEIDFSRFGFTLSTHEALGWSAGADSMRATLNPTVDHGLVEVHGTFNGETIVGSWRYTSDPGGATGTFTLRRVGR